MAGRVGQQLGNYLLTRFLGKGGFAEVYKGEHIYLGTHAAIKVLHTQLESEDVDKFRKEARIIAKLKHPNIIRVLEFGVEGNTPYLVMEYAQDKNLRERHPHGSVLPITVILSYVKQIAAALQHAHDNKVVHRDVNPRNLLVDRDKNDHILLSDFGISVIAHSTHSLTPQFALGTKEYIAPEQINGLARPASDQYSLGIIVYEWLCGTPPFTGSLGEIITKHLTSPPPPFDVNLHIPAQVEQVVFKALAKDPQQRYESVQAFADALEQAYSSQASTVHASPKLKSPAPVQPLPPTIKVLSETDLAHYYREGVKARERGDYAQAVILWQELLDYDPDFQNGTLIPQMAKLLELRALQAGQRGEWQEAITSWQALLQIEPQDTQTQEYLPVAKQNQKYVWVYENARQFANDGDFAAAKKLLEEVWQNAPFYGDPAELAKKVRLPVPPRFERIIAIQQKTKLATERRKSRHQAIEDFSDQVGLRFPVIHILFFCLVSGGGGTIGVLTQSWKWALISGFAVSLLGALLGYRKAMNWLMIIALALIGSAITYGLASYTSSLPYGQPQLGHFWFLGDRTLWIGRQVDAGVIFGIVFGALLVLYGQLEDDYDIFLRLVVIVFWLFLISLCLSLFGAGFGFGPGWLFLLMGLVVGFFGAIGVFASNRICRPLKKRAN